MELRPATTADAPRLTELVQVAYGHYVELIGGKPRPMTDDYVEVVRRGGVTVADRDGGIVGLVVLVVEDGELWVDNVAVDPDQQGTGVGRALLEHAEAEAARQGFDSVVLLTHELMGENLALYQRIGYRERERRPPGDGYLVVMEKPVAGSAT